MGKDSQNPTNALLEYGRSPNSGQEPADSPATNEEISSLRREETLGNPKEEEEEEQVSREAKRRRVSCPSAIDTCPSEAPNNVAGLSFSFDIKVQPMYSTPKFGSFCSDEDLKIPDLQDPVPGRSLEEAGEAKGEVRIGPEVEPLLGLGAADGGDAAEDER